jgi:hypothetical protein
VVTRVSFLNHGFGASDQAIWSVLQHLSSALGFAVICAAYILWARARGVSTFDYKKINLSKRFLFWSALVVLSVLGALALWNNPVSLVEDHPSATEKAIVSATIRSVRFFTAGLFSTALVLKVRKKLAELQAARAL